MVFRAVVMETQAVSHIWILGIRHVLNCTFSQKRACCKSKDQKHFLSESLVYTDKYIYLMWVFFDLNNIWIPKNLYVIYLKGC